MNNFGVTRFRMAQADVQKIVDAVYYGTHRAAEKMYEFHPSVYDEDAGVFTDYGQNNAARTWAQVHFQQLCAHSIINVEWNQNDGDPAYITLLDISIGAVVQLLWCLWSDDKLQTEVWRSVCSDNWESDGHYGNRSREKFISDTIKPYWIDRKTGRRICDLLQNTCSRDAQRLRSKLIIGKTSKDIRAQLKTTEV